MSNGTGCKQPQPVAPATNIADLTIEKEAYDMKMTLVVVSVAVLFAGCVESVAEEKSAEKGLGKTDEPKNNPPSISEANAREIAKNAVRTSEFKFAKSVPADAKLILGHNLKEGRYEITFSSPTSNVGVKDGGIYAVVWVDAKTGQAMVLGAP